MKRIIVVVAAVLLALGQSGCIAWLRGGPAIRVDAGEPFTRLEKYATKELVTHLDKLFHNPVPVAEDLISPTFVVGTPESNFLIKQAVKDGELNLPNGPNSEQGYVIRTIHGCTYVAARTDVGLLYAVYALLEEYGAYFQISGVSMPPERYFSHKQLDIVAVPAFKYRGIQPADSLICGIYGDNSVDIRKLITNATRMRLNKLELHFRPGYVMFSDVAKGKVVDPDWVSIPNEYAPQDRPGVKAFGATRRYSVEPWEKNRGNSPNQAEACQAMLRSNLKYAKQLGWDVTVGIDLMQPPGTGHPMTDKPGESWNGATNTIDPLAQDNVATAKARLEQLRGLYPVADHYALWQEENGGRLSKNVGRETGAAAMRQQYQHWGENEKAGDRDYAYLLLEVLKGLPAEEQDSIATGGYAIDHLFNGMDKDFPSGVVFSSVVDSATGDISKAMQSRKRWLSCSWEKEGLLWFPQFRAHRLEPILKEAYHTGVESICVTGWKLSGDEQNIRYLAEFPWNPRLTAAAFYASYAKRLYQLDSDQLGEFYTRSELAEGSLPKATPDYVLPAYLGPGSSRLLIPELVKSPAELRSDRWLETVKRARQLVREQQALVESDRKSIDMFLSQYTMTTSPNSSWTRLMINRLEFRILYSQSMIRLNEALLAYDDIANRHGLGPATAAADFLVGMAIDKAKDAVNKYAEECRNRNDQGILVLLNLNYYDVLKEFREKL